jgi:hypothetical protein
MPIGTSLCSTSTTGTSGGGGGGASVLLEQAMAAEESATHHRAVDRLARAMRTLRLNGGGEALAGTFRCSVVRPSPGSVDP